jgi:hypothetical protein
MGTCRVTFLDQSPAKHNVNLISAYHPELPNVKVTPSLKSWGKTDFIDGPGEII